MSGEAIEAYRGRSLADRVTTWIAVLAATAMLAWIQLSFDGLYDLDSYFHVRAAEQLAANGVRKQLPQAVFSTWADAYSDKDFLFHGFLIPFASGEDLVAGGKWGVIALDLLVLAAVAFAIETLGIRFGALWILLLVAASPYYVTRLLPLRPHLVGLALIAVEISLLVRDRWKTLFGVAFVHVLAHSSFPLLLALLVARAATSLVRGAAVPWRSAGAVIAGVLVATLVHPYFPNNLSVAYSQIVELAAQLWTGAGGIPREAFGSELGPMKLDSFVKQAPAWIPAVAGVIAVLAVQGRHGWSTRDLFLALVAAGFLGLALASRRFLDVAVLSAVLLAGALWTRLAAGRMTSDLFRASPLRAGAAAALLVACVIAGQARVWAEVPADLARQSFGGVFRGDVARLDEIAEPGDVVYHPSWRDFSYLYFFRPDGRYIVGLDPVFLWGKDPRLFRKSFALSRGMSQNPRQVLARDFDARWIFVTREARSQAFRNLLAKTPGFEIVHDGYAAEIWRVPTGPVPAPARRPGRPAKRAKPAGPAS